MFCKRFLLLMPLLLAALLTTTSAAHYRPVANAQETKTESTTGYPTGTKVPKSGTYRASNKYLEIIIVLAAGDVFPPFADGTRTIWYLRISNTKDQ